MAQYKVLVCCGTGIATSVQVSNKLKAMLQKRGLNVDMHECKAIEISTRAASLRPHAIVSTTQVSLKGVDIPVFGGVPFLTGVGADAVADQIADALKKK